MPQPTKEQFDAAAKKVMETAKPGLSRDEFFRLIDQQLTPMVEPVSAMDMVSGRVGRDSGTQKEPDTWRGGFIKGLKENFVDPLVGSDLAKHAARPTSAADVAGLLLPSGIGMGSAKEFIPAAKKLYQGAKRGAAEREGLKKVPAVINGMWGATKRNPDQVISNFERKIFSEGHVAPDVTSIPDNGLPMEEMPTATPAVELQSPQDVIAGSGDYPYRTTTGKETSRIPYAEPTSRPSTSGFGKVTGRAPTLDEALQSALQESRATGADPAVTSTLAETPMTGGMQKPKVGKRPGGYTTDIPARGEAPAPVGGEDAIAAEGVQRSPSDLRTSSKSARFGEENSGADQLEELLNAIHGEEGGVPNINPEGMGTQGSSFADTMKSVEPEFNRDVHTGAERSSPAAKSAEAHHKMFGEMDADYQRRIADPLASFLFAALSGGALASRSTTPNQGGLQ